MILIGLTGGIGTGKSSVAELFVEYGAVRIDADAIARLVVQPGEAAHEAVTKRFGEELLDDAHNIDRAALAKIVFSDRAALADLEAIVHPCVSQVIRAAISEESSTDHVVILEVPLLISADGSSRYEVDGLIVVDAPEDLAIERLVRHRQMDPSDARARIDAQIPNDVRLRAADFIIVNVGTTDELRQMVERAWQWISTLIAR